MIHTQQATIEALQAKQEQQEQQEKKPDDKLSLESKNLKQRTVLVQLVFLYVNIADTRLALTSSIKFLLELGANIHSKSRSGKSAHETLGQSGLSFKQLAQSQPKQHANNFDSKGSSGRTILMELASAIHTNNRLASQLLPIMAFILTQSATPNLTSNHGWSAAHFLAATKLEAAHDFIVNPAYSFNLDQTDCKNATPNTLMEKNKKCHQPSSPHANFFPRAPTTDVTGTGSSQRRILH